ncbi:putative lysine-specific demethylase JMJD5 isoform X1 [Carex littledalei]|uniref:Putative lysine-specific demethylase JMJD5 isoform X1 n=1 Tax=Carex littledalei TaxID=544730 RepID=A0A833R7A5_9POAL|nr:putative lysine-specific demethylase JMJD5 isoform X1 [Carex littledalei]
MGDETGCSGDRMVAEGTRRAPLLRQITEEGGFAFVSSVEKAAAGDIRAAEAAREMAWEQLHTGPWNEVVLAWRDAYAMACLHMAEIKSSGGERREALRTLDMGLIMGGPLLRAELDAAINRITAATPSNGQEPPITGFGVESDGDADASQWEEGLCTNKDPHEALRILPSKSLSGRSIERRALISFETFISDYFLRQMPVIITGCMEHWPASTKWKNINYLKQIAGDRTVPVEVGKNYVCTEWKQELITFSQFLERMGSHNPENTTYLAQHPLFDQIRQLKEDILVPDYCYAGGGVLKPLNAWFGPVGTVTPLHHDPHDNILAQVVGRKYIRLYPASLSDELYPHDESMLINTSQVDLDHIDTAAFPKIENLEFMDCILDEGEMLYIPRKWWHYVRSLSTSFSVSFWWSAATPEQ